MIGRPSSLPLKRSVLSWNVKLDKCTNLASSKWKYEYEYFWREFHLSSSRTISGPKENGGLKWDQLKGKKMNFSAHLGNLDLFYAYLGKLQFFTLRVLKDIKYKWENLNCLPICSMIKLGLL